MDAFIRGNVSKAFVHVFRYRNMEHAKRVPGSHNMKDKQYNCQKKMTKRQMSPKT